MLFWKTKPSPQPTPSDDLTTALTFREVIAATDLEHRARQFAIKGEPAQRHPGLTITENETLDLVEHRIVARNAELDASAAALAQQLQLLTSHADQDPAIRHHRTVDALADVFTTRTPAIRDALALERTRGAELKAFRDEHEIARPAEYPKSKPVHFRWLIPVVTGEAVAESTLLIPATPDGLVGATALALGVAVVTTTIGLMIGFGPLRYLAAKAVMQRIVSWVALPLLCGSAALVSLYVAHYRHMAGLSADTPNDAEVIEHLLTQTFDLSGPGWLLLFLSLACTAFAVWKGYTASDPIPGYEKADRAYIDARDDRDFLLTDMRGAIAAVKTSTVKSALDQPGLARLKRDHLLNSYADLESKRDQIAALAKQETELGLRAIARYRHVNLTTRADGITPDYYSQGPVISAEPAPLPVGLKERLEAATANAIVVATKAAEDALQIARMLDHTSDRAAEIMASIERAHPRDGENPVLALRGTLEATLNAAALPRPDATTAIAPPAVNNT
jgi:hypothetical protein